MKTPLLPDSNTAETRKLQWQPSEYAQDESILKERGPGALLNANVCPR